MKDKIKKASKAHTVYKTSQGQRVPGTTTITGLLNKPHLVSWANNLGLQGIDSSKYRDEAADIGTLAHAMIQAHLQGDAVQYDQYGAYQVDLAQNSAISYYEWEKGHALEVILCECPLVSYTKLYGGTVDCYCKLDGVYTLLDFKTGKAIYDEYFIQLAAYRALLEEHGCRVDQCKILRIGRDETDGFEERTIFDTSKYFKMFEHLLGYYHLKKELKMQ